MNIKRAMQKYIEADPVMSNAFPRVYPVFQPVSSNQLNISLLKSIYPNITIVETAPEREYSENGLMKGLIQTEVQIDFTTLVDLNNFTHPQPDKRDAEFDKIDAYDDLIESFIITLSDKYKKPAIMAGIVINSLFIVSESSTDETIDSDIAQNFSFYRKTLRLAIKYNPVTG